jgi:hypothetical protein
MARSCAEAAGELATACSVASQPMAAGPKGAAGISAAQRPQISHRDGGEYGEGGLLSNVRICCAALWTASPAIGRRGRSDCLWEPAVQMDMEDQQTLFEELRTVELTSEVLSGLRQRAIAQGRALHHAVHQWEPPRFTS